MFQIEVDANGCWNLSRVPLTGALVAVAAGGTGVFVGVGGTGVDVRVGVGGTGVGVRVGVAGTGVGVGVRVGVGVEVDNGTTVSLPGIWAIAVAVKASDETPGVALAVAVDVADAGTGVSVGVGGTLVAVGGTLVAVDGAVVGVGVDVDVDVDAAAVVSVAVAAADVVVAAAGTGVSVAGAGNGVLVDAAGTPMLVSVAAMLVFVAVTVAVSSSPAALIETALGVAAVVEVARWSERALVESDRVVSAECHRGCGAGAAATCTSGARRNRRAVLASTCAANCGGASIAVRPSAAGTTAFGLTTTRPSGPGSGTEISSVIQLSVRGLAPLRSAASGAGTASSRADVKSRTSLPPAS